MWVPGIGTEDEPAHSLSISNWKLKRNTFGNPSRISPYHRLTLGQVFIIKLLMETYMWLVSSCGCLNKKGKLILWRWWLTKCLKSDDPSC